MKLPALRIDWAKPKHAERLAAGERSPMSASRGAAWDGVGQGAQDGRAVQAVGLMLCAVDAGGGDGELVGAATPRPLP
jgi:hypothetical protein